MPLIKPTILSHTPQELGRIKIGRRGPDHPIRQSYFTITTMERGEDGNFNRDESIHADPAVGEKPTELAGMLMHPEVEENWHSEMQIYEGRTRKIWTCDGENAIDLESGEAKPCARAHGGKCRCKPYGRLHLQLWSAPALGYHVFRTTSWTSVANIQSALESIRARFGTLLYAPIKLRVYPKEQTYTDDQGNRRITTAHVVGLVLAMGFNDAAREMLEASRELVGVRRELLELPPTVTYGADVRQALDAAEVRDEAEIGEEFHPETEREEFEGPPPGDPAPPPPPVAAPEPTPDEELGSRVAATPAECSSLSTLANSARKLELVDPGEFELIRETVQGADGSEVRTWIEELRYRIGTVQLDPPGSFQTPAPEEPPEGDLFAKAPEPEA